MVGELDEPQVDRDIYAGGRKSQQAVSGWGPHLLHHHWATFGQFPTGGACTTITRQGVTASIAAVEFGVVTTDIHGNGKFTVIIGPIASGTYNLEFDTRNGAGCGLTGGGGNGADICEADFQSPGPTFGDAATIVIP